MKKTNGTVAVLVGIGVFVASANLRLVAQNTPERTERLCGINQELYNRTAIHEESANISFDNTGVVSNVGYLDEVDKNATPNF